MPVAIRRRSAQRTCFAALFNPYPSQPTVEGVTWFAAEDPHAPPPLACLVERGGTSDLWLLAGRCGDAARGATSGRPCLHLSRRGRCLVARGPLTADSSSPAKGALHAY